MNTSLKQVEEQASRQHGANSSRKWSITMNKGQVLVLHLRKRLRKPQPGLLHFRKLVLPPQKAPSRCSSSDSHLLSCIGQIVKTLLFLRLPTVHVSPSIGCHFGET